MQPTPIGIASLIVFLLASCGITHAAVFDVPGDFATIQEAIDAASDGDTILVGPGTWSRITLQGKQLEIRSTDGPATTTLDGGGAGPVVRLLLGEPAGTLLEGFTITGGTGRTKGGRTYGGGILGVDTSATIRDCHVTANTATSGGGIAFYRGNPVIEDCEISANAGEEGRGIWLREGSPIVRRCDIHDNPTIDNSSFGGGIFVQDAAFLIEANEIYQHRFDRNKSWSFQIGGGIAVTGDSSGEIVGNTVRRNQGCPGAGMSIDATGTILVRHNAVLDNDSECGDDGFPGGGILAEGPDIRIDSNSIVGNGPGWPGGGIYASADVVIVNNFLIFNVGGVSGGGISGGGILTNNTIAFNSVRQGVGGQSGPLGIRSNGIITNCIVTRNGGQLSGDQIGGDTPVVTYCIVEGGYAGEGNLDADPLLALGGDGLLRITSGSVAVDAGTLFAPELPTVDADGDDRVQDGDGDGTATVDIGADELRREEAVLFGTIEVGIWIGSILTVNGSSGDPARRVTVEAGDAILLEIDDTGGASNDRYVVHGNLGAPTPASLTALPRMLGTIGFPLLLPGATPSVVFNSIGKTDRIGESAYFGQALPVPPLAPATLLDLPSGDALNLPPGTTITFQGVANVTAQAPAEFGITNGVVLLVE